MMNLTVGNIPYDATEEKLKEVFSEVGPVVSFRLVYDRDSGKPKGYGFCEYNDKETALSAMRNLNNYELNGRNLRVDNAANEKNRDDAERRNVQQQQQQLPIATGIPGLPMGPIVPQYDNPYGPECEPQEAPEVISRAVANLPPEQMFELASQMKQCIETNPNEARNMLMQNPQLSFALLQALVVMKTIDPQIASSMLHRPPPTTPVMPSAAAEPAQPWAQNFPGGVPTVADPRLRPGSGPVDPRFTSQGAPQMRQPPNQGGTGGPSVHEQQDRAALVMQLLQLTDAQISLLTPEQQISIRELKAQMNR